MINYERRLDESLTAKQRTLSNSLSLAEEMTISFDLPSRVDRGNSSLAARSDSCWPKKSKASEGSIM